VLSFTPGEAIDNNYCEGTVESLDELLLIYGFQDYDLQEYELSKLDKLIAWLMNPYLQSVLIMIMIGGIYFELQTPGIGFPIAASLVSALLYFAPLYLEGLASHWEILIFIIGLILLAIEVFAIPGFGVTGISGIVLLFTGMAMAMVQNADFEFSVAYFTPVFRAFTIVVGSGLLAFLVMLFTADRLFNSPLLKFMTLQTKEDKELGYMSFDSALGDLIGEKAVAVTVLRPSGRISIKNKLYDAVSDFGFIEKGTAVKVVRFEHGQLYVVVDEKV
jgi:membrane-bound serine protease (ClpP class)